ncbi:MAG: hypothetical protein ABSB89_07090 [Candidatus Bathyarchaeia archaeon]|jgi:hypothetical protein
MSKRRPNSVTIVAILTLIAFFVLASLDAIVVVSSIGFVGGGGEGDYENPTPPYPVIALPLQICWEYALILGIVLFLIRSKYIWYASIVFWILVCILLANFAYSGWVNVWASFPSDNMQDLEMGIGQLTLILLPYVYAVGCSIYFIFKRGVRDYFDV